ncbi:hypothetical protein [Jatrophihabitans sp.]|uniref:hypothetical protein n=1 Tax=Jatrophihabitans sp. TaxID=1932789 RepID=UPI0030C71FAF
MLHRLVRDIGIRLGLRVADRLLGSFSSCLRLGLLDRLVGDRGLGLGRLSRGLRFGLGLGVRFGLWLGFLNQLCRFFGDGFRDGLLHRLVRGFGDGLRLRLLDRLVGDLGLVCFSRDLRFGFGLVCLSRDLGLVCLSRGLGLVCLSRDLRFGFGLGFGLRV